MSMKSKIQDKISMIEMLRDPRTSTNKMRKISHQLGPTGARTKRCVDPWRCFYCWKVIFTLMNNKLLRKWYHSMIELVEKVELTIVGLSGLDQFYSDAENQPKYKSIIDRWPKIHRAQLKFITKSFTNFHARIGAKGNPKFGTSWDSSHDLEMTTEMTQTLTKKSTLLKAPAYSFGKKPTNYN